MLTKIQKELQKIQFFFNKNDASVFYQVVFIVRAVLNVP